MSKHVAVAVIGLLGVVGIGIALAGPLDPPAGPVTPTFKTLTEVEPRIAVNAVNTPGDANSLFRIAQPGSYYLTGNIAGAAGKHGIEIAVGGVTLDLNGFDLAGVPGSMEGVSARFAGLSGIAVRGGSVHHWGGHGVDLSSTVCGTLSDIHAFNNSGKGILAGDAWTLRACVATGNLSEGIATEDACVIQACTVMANGNSGIVAGESCTVAQCAADGNGAASTGLSEGIFAGAGSTIVNCTSQNNTSALVGGVGDRGMGFRTADHCTITNCVATGNRGHGFRLLTNSHISRCSASENGAGSTASAAIHAAGADNRIDDNHAANSDFGVQAAAAGNIIMRNTAAGNGVNYSLVANNIYGPIIDRRIPTTVPSTPGVNGFAAAGTLGSTDANANFSY